MIVVLCHAHAPLMAGGYVGVDVFFVISGFLITRWLVTRSIHEGHVPLSKFYGTRAKRILPAAALTLIVTCIASWHWLNSVRTIQVLHDAVWSAFFMANIHFAQVGTDYFARGEPPSPLQHFWTLAVEEQFYLAWPLILAVAMALLGARTTGIDRRMLRRLFLVASGIAALSLAYSIHDTSSNPTSAYFSTLARGWELGVGVMIALAVPWIRKIGVWQRALMTWAGLAGILLATLLYTSSTPFPGDAALLPVLSAALVIAGGIRPGPARGAVSVLRRPEFQLTGNISYALYLWHWPILVIAAEAVGHSLSFGVNLLLIAFAYGLSYVTFKIYEDPLRHARALRAPRMALTLWPASVGAVLAATILIAGSVTTHPTAKAKLDASRATKHTLATGTQVQLAVHKSITPSMLAAPIPNALDPSVDNLESDIYDMKGCMSVGGTTSPLCTWGDTSASQTMVVFGDSHAQMWMAGFVRFAQEKHYKLIPLVKDGCSPVVLHIRGPCQRWYHWAVGEVGRLHPALLVMSQYWSSWGTEGVSTELNDLRPEATKMALIEDAPGRPVDAVDCLLASGATLGSCTFPITSRQRSIYREVRQEVRSDGVTYIPTLQWLCANNACPGVVGTIITYRDRHHLSATYANELANPLAEKMASVLHSPA